MYDSIVVELVDYTCATRVRDLSRDAFDLFTAFIAQQDLGVVVFPNGDGTATTVFDERVADANRSTRRREGAGGFFYGYRAVKRELDS